jgi:hypothetical protein
MWQFIVIPVCTSYTCSLIVRRKKHVSSRANKIKKELTWGAQDTDALRIAAAATATAAVAAVSMC